MKPIAAILLVRGMRYGIAPQVRNFVRQAEQAKKREKGKGIDRDEALER